MLILVRSPAAEGHPSRWAVSGMGGGASAVRRWGGPPWRVSPAGMSRSFLHPFESIRGAGSGGLSSPAERMRPPLPLNEAGSPSGSRPRFVLRGQDVSLGAAAGRRRVPPQRQEGPKRAEGVSFRVQGGRLRPRSLSGAIADLRASEQHAPARLGQLVQLDGPEVEGLSGGDGDAFDDPWRGA